MATLLVVMPQLSFSLKQLHVNQSFFLLTVDVVHLETHFYLVQLSASCVCENMREKERERERLHVPLLCFFFLCS